MPLEVIGAGFGRTGTTSLQKALDVLLAPGKCYHYDVIAGSQHIQLWQDALEKRTAPDWEAILEKYGYVATMDHPCAEFYEDLMMKYPNAKVILSEHPGGPEKWHESKVEHAAKWAAMRTWPIKPLVALVFPFVQWRLNASYSQKYPVSQVLKLADTVTFFVFGDQGFHDRAHALKTYQDWNAMVKTRVPPERLLVFNVKQGWGPLCEFLGKTLPNIPFPKEDRKSGTNIKRVMLQVKVGLWMSYVGLLALGVIIGVRTYKRQPRVFRI